jgi:iron complex outermembrane receptor protein
MKKHHYLYMSLSAVMVIGMAASAAAQTTAGPQSTPAPEAGGGPPPSPTNADAASVQLGTPDTAGTTQDIIVTATKRNEALEKVPISVAVFTAQAIQAAGITRASNYLASVPNVTFIEDNAGEAYVNIRGQTAVRNSDPNVAFVVDGVTLSSVKGFNQDLFDIQQIEVLKGPQSAIYGRNAAAGAIVVTTKRPGDHLAGQITGAVGNQDTKRVNASISGPITDTLGFSVAGSFRHTDGSYTNITTGEKPQRANNANGRARLVYDDHDRLTIDLKVDGSKTYGGGTAYSAQVVGLPIGGFPGTALDANNTDIPFNSNIPTIFKETFINASLKAEYDLGFATLTSVTGANRLNQYFGSDSPPYIPQDTGAAGGGTVQQYTYRDRSISEELRLTSPSTGPFRWQAGLYYLRYTRNQVSKIDQDLIGGLPSDERNIDPPGSATPTVSYGNPKYTTTNYAPFASVQFDVTDHLHLSAAGRYDTERRSIRENADPKINPLSGASYNTCVALTGRTFDDCINKTTFHQFEPKASISYDLTGIGSIYASYGRGFKSGGFNPIGARQALLAALPAGVPASSVYVQDGYSKEVSTSYEVGTKLRLFNRKLGFNFAVFSTDISGAQQFAFFPSVGIQATVSIDKVKARGFDMDLDYTLPFGLRVFGGYGYVDSKVKAFGGNPADVGNRAPGAFKSTLTLGATESFDLGSNLQIVPRVEYNHYGTIWWDVDNSPGTKRKPLSLVNARLTLKSGDRWQISAFGDNLTNKRYFQEVVPLLSVFTVNFKAPLRTYGLEARIDF